MSEDSLDLEAAALQLEQSGEFRVLRRLRPLTQFAIANGKATKRAVFVDVETTGLEHDHDEVIEIGVVPFVYTVDGTVVELLEPFHSYRQPSNPIPEEITKLTGITNDMVRGASIDTQELGRIVASANLVIAHNAAFDRKFCENLSEVFTTKPWACSMAQVPWREYGFEGSKLSYLVGGLGYFYDGHRAIDDCFAGIHLLSQMLPGADESALSKLLNNARTPMYRVWALHSPFDLKAILKRRGYRWNGDENGKPRSWYIDVLEDKLDQELDFLQREIYLKEVDVPVVRIHAEDRFSERL